MSHSMEGNSSSLQHELRLLQSKYSPTLSKDEALDYAVQAAELHLKFLRLATSKTEKAELSKKTKSLLDEAERIKTSEKWQASDESLIDLDPVLPHVISSAGRDRSGMPSSAQDASPLTPGSAKSRQYVAHTRFPEPTSSRPILTQEKSILLKSARVNGHIFPQWNDQDLTKILAKPEGGRLYTDATELGMSKEQSAVLDGWKRPADALPPPSWRTITEVDSKLEELTLYMKPLNVVDLVQDAATDCSIVASLSAGIARTEHGFSEILATAITPFDPAVGHPSMSPYGIYIVRLNFNGCSRGVIIDDRLPVSKTSRILHVFDRNNPYLLWPALLEKAYLKVRGGYDFPGSNSGTDLWVLTGWIPEQIFLQRDDIDPNNLWSRIHKAFGYGDVLITLGTGVMTVKTEQDVGLAGEHDYAVVDLDDSGGRNRLLIKNPWLNATAWKDYHVTIDESDQRTDDGSSTDTQSWVTAPSIQSAHTRTEQIDRPTASNGRVLSPGMFWLELTDVLQNFESIYLNWNPALFKHRQDIHFSWNLMPGSGSSRSPPGSFNNNPQYTVQCSKKDIVWIVVTKHFTDSRGEQTGRGAQGYISLYAFDNNGKRCFLSKGSISQTPYVDSPQTLLKLETDPHLTYTIVLSEQDLPNSQHSFTLSAFSRVPLTLQTAAPRFLQQSLIRSSWTTATAGGNASSPKYPQNPQFALKVTEPSVLCMTLETATPGLRVHAKILHGGGQRVFSVTNRDILIDTGDYRRGCALADTKVAVQEGTYTIICSTFEAEQLGEFTLRVYSDVKTSLITIAKEGAGRIRTKLADASFAAGVRSVAAPVFPQRLCLVNFTARNVPSATSSLSENQSSSTWLPPHSPVRLTLDVGRGQYRHILVASGAGEFTYSSSGIRTDDITVQPEQTKRQDMWLVLERRGGFDSVGQAEERIAVDMFTDTMNAVDLGVWREWE